MHEHIEDEAEVARRSVPPPPAVFLASPAFLETAQDIEDRQRQQKLLDEARKKRERQDSIVMDLERTIQNLIPPTTDVRVKYRAMKERLLNKFGPNSAMDAEETWRKRQTLHGDHRGWDVYHAALDSLVEVLTKTPVRDTANNPVRNRSQ
jgi:hypothetical protein